MTGNNDGTWPVAPVSVGSLVYGTTIRADGKYHLAQAAIELNADTWVTKSLVHKQFTFLHEAGHSLAVTHEGPVMSPVAFGIAPFTSYSSCASQNYNCLASLYDVADYDSWTYDPVANTGTNLGIQNSNTSRVDRSMIGSYYGDRAAQPTDTCIGNPSPGVLRVTAIDTTRVNTSKWVYLYKWNGSSWIHQTGKFVSLTHSPAFGERLQADFTIETATGTYLAGMISYKNSTGWNYTEPTEWSQPITVSSYTNSDIHPPCTIVPRRSSSNGSHLNWVQSSQDVDNVVVEFRAMKGYSTLTSLPTLTWTFVTNVSSGTQMWHIFASNPPAYARFAYRLKAENQSAQSLYSDWVLVEPWDPNIP